MTLMFSSMCSQGLYQVQQLYFRQELEFTKDNFVTYSEISGAGGMIVQLFLTPVLIEKAGEKSTVIIGLSVYVLYMLMYATEFADTPTKAYANSLIQDIRCDALPSTMRCELHTRRCIVYQQRSANHDEMCSGIVL